jgi:hypothetical protein
VVPAAFTTAHLPVLIQEVVIGQTRVCESAESPRVIWPISRRVAVGRQYLLSLGPPIGSMTELIPVAIDTATARQVVVR